MDPECNPQDVIRCHLCETTDTHLCCDVCQIYLCQDCEGKHFSDGHSEHKVEHFQNNSIDLQYSLQDVVRCHLCETPVPPLHCAICNMHLCKDCEGEHLSDKSKEHIFVPFKYRGSIPKCQKHNLNICKLFCEQCNISICSLCIFSDEHQTHDTVDITHSLKGKMRVLQKDLNELEKILYPKYQEIASYISVQTADLNDNTKTLTAAIEKQGEEMHREIDIRIRKLKYDLHDINSKHLALLNKQEVEIQLTLCEIEKRIADIKKLCIESSDVSLISAYKSTNADFRKLPPKHTIPLPRFTPQKINKEQISQQFGSLYKKLSPGFESSPPVRELIDVPQIITDINTEYGSYALLSVSCLCDEDIWTCGIDNILRLYNLQGDLVQLIQNKSGNNPWDIAVTGNGYLVYTSYYDKSVNIVKKSKIKTVIKLRGWKPRGVCCTSSDDLLVVMVSDDYKQTKVVRYSGSMEKQSIQYDEGGQPVFSCGKYNTIKYICENRNLDVCVSDNGAHAVVVVNQAGYLRFTYTCTHSTTKGSFNPRGITTDSQSRILIADCDNKCIYILDQDGHFLRYIDNCNLQDPWGLCVDSNDNLLVAEYTTGKIIKIQYYV